MPGNGQRVADRDSGARAEHERPPLVPELVGIAARTAPTALAVADQGCALTYGSLERRANALAHRLRALGVERGALVGLCHDRAASAVVGALAVLKAGGGYVGLDPAYPDTSLDYVIQDAEVRVLLTQASVADRLGSISCEVIDLDADADPIAAADSPPQGFVVPSDVAYVIYTSGSTGIPKGVAISHGSLLNLVKWHRQAFRLTPSDRASMVASPAFDASVWELWPYLVAGASLHVADRFTPQAADALRDWLVSERVTIGFVPTPMAEALLELEWPSAPALRTMLTGGDVLHRRPARGTPFTLVNNYGVAEATVVSTSGVVEPGETGGRLPDIGRPILNAQLHVLDPSARPVASGEPGELYIGGPSVAVGYVNRPNLTAERFVPDPSASRPGAVLYRTGDRVRRTEDGTFEFLGRLDDQVAIRGYRIEPAEVMAALASHPAVGSCVVVSRPDARGEPRLVAYLVARRGAHPSQQELRSHLSARLPSHMVPSAFVQVEALPVTSNGKIDREALPAPARERRAAVGTSAPRTATEVAVADVLEELLDVHGIGRDENFFELGGHSLMGAQLVVRVQQRFGVDLALLTIFENPSVAGIAAVIDERRLAPNRDWEPAAEASRLVVQIRSGTLPALFCIHPVDGSLAAVHQILGDLDSERAVYGALPPQVRNRYDPSTSVEEMVDELLPEILRVQPDGPYLMVGYSFGGLLAYALAGRLRDLGHEVRLVGLIDTMSPAEFLREYTWRSRATYVLRGGIRPAIGEAVQVARQRVRERRLTRRQGRGDPAAQSDIPNAEVPLLLGLRYRPVGHDGHLVVFVARARKRGPWPRALQQSELDPTGGWWSGRRGNESARRRERSLGWSEVHCRPVQVVVVPGDHGSVLAGTNVRTLARALADALRKSEAAAPASVSAAAAITT
jgi:amino acid adenylation domain-containing protein